MRSFSQVSPTLTEAPMGRGGELSAGWRTSVRSPVSCQTRLSMALTNSRVQQTTAGDSSSLAHLLRKTSLCGSRVPQKCLGSIQIPSARNQLFCTSSNEAVAATEHRVPTPVAPRRAPDPAHLFETE